MSTLFLLTYRLYSGKSYESAFTTVLKEQNYL